MARNDGRLSPGDPLVISARAWNRAQDAADIVLGQNVGGAALRSTSAPYTWVYVKNIGSQQIERFKPVKFGGFEGPPGGGGGQDSQFFKAPVLRGEAASSECTGVAVEPIAANKIGRVAVAGSVQLATADKGKMQSTSVVYESNGWSLVVIGGGGGGQQLFFATFAGTWRKDAPRNIKTVTLLRPNPDGDGPFDPYFLPMLDESDNPVQVVAMNVLAHMPAINEQIERFCMVKKFGPIANVNGGDDVYLLVSGEC